MTLIHTKKINELKITNFNVDTQQYPEDHDSGEPHGQQICVAQSDDQRAHQQLIGHGV